MAVDWNDQATIAAVRRGALRGVIMGANLIRNEVLRLILQTPKTGRIYRRRGVEHQASAPGEAPASDTGNLVRNITVEVDAPKLTAKVNSAAKYAAALELGTERMEPRPHMRVALANKRQEVEAVVAREIAKELGQ